MIVFLLLAHQQTISVKFTNQRQTVLLLFGLMTQNSREEQCVQRFELTHEQRRMKRPHRAERMKGNSRAVVFQPQSRLDVMRKLPSLARSERDESGKN